MWCFAKKLCTRRDAGAGALLRWSCQSPVAHSHGLLNHPNSFQGEMFKLKVKFDADSLLYLLSHFECDGHTVHMLTQWHLLPPQTSTVMPSLFTHAHSSPLPLAARLHRCCTNCSCYINNGQTFSRHISYIWLCTWFFLHVFNIFPYIRELSLPASWTVCLDLDVVKTWSQAWWAVEEAAESTRQQQWSSWATGLEDCPWM